MQRGIGLLLIAVFAGACGGDETAISTTGVACVLDSECNTSLACTFGRCHEECDEATDCEDDEMCVLDEHRAKVCQLPEDVSCVLNSDCPIPLVCAQDLKCRNECDSPRDCATRTQLCVPPGKVCAEPEDVVNGVLRLASGAADAGAPGEGGTPDGGSVGVGAGGASGGAGIMSEAGSGGSGADAGSSGGMDAGPQPGTDAGLDAATHDASLPDAAPQPPLEQEMEPNETRDEPNLITAGQPLAARINDGDDLDFFSIRVPSGDRAGGFFTGSLSDFVSGALRVSVYDADTHLSIVNSTNITVGSSVFWHWAGGAGKTYYMVVSRQPTGAESFDYTLLVDYTAIDDPFEPNDTRESPASLALGTTVTAYCYAGVSGEAPRAENYQDWYLLDEPLSAGTVTVRIENVATNQTLRVGLYDTNNARLESKSGMLGASFDAVLDVATPGTYRIMIDPLTPPDYAGTTQAVPDHFTRAYRVTVTQ